MVGADKDVSEQVDSIEEQIGRIEARTRLTEEFWKSQNNVSRDLDGGLDDCTSHAANLIHFDRDTSTTQTAPGVLHDRNKKMIKPKQEKVSLAPRSSTPSKIPALSNMTSIKSSQPHHTLL